MSDEVTLEVTQVTENVTVETTAGDVVEVKVVATQGAAATVNVGTTATGAAGTNASVTNSGSTSAAVFNFTIPRGADGANGPNSVTSATTSDGTANLSLSNVSTATATVSGLLTAGHIHGNLAGTLYTHVRTGEAMSKGDPFYISGFHVGSSQPIAMRADASNAAKMPAVGVMDADYANNTSGANGIISGTLSSVNTNGYTVNSPIYVADGGGYSNTAGTIPQQVGITERANANTGAFIVTSPKLISFADITDSETGTATLGLSSISIYPSGKIYYASTNSGGFVGLSGQLATDARDVYLPNASGNLALVTSTTGQIASADVSGLTALATTTPAANVATFLATPTSANLASALTDESGTGGGFVRAEGATLTTPTLVGTPVFNATAYTYGTGAAAAHRTALGVTSAQLQTESLFSLLTLQESDAGVYTANAGTATASQDGDSLSLSATTANQRPNVYRFRNWNRNPGVSGTANAVIPVRLACAGNIYHLGSGANGASFRCGFGMVNGASAVAANANATTGRGFGWRIAWNSSTSKLEFNLWAHDGTTYVEGTGIDTGLGAGNLDGIFNIIVGLASDGTVSANTWFGSSTSTSAVPSSTPTVTLAGGPTSGTFANLGTPSWIVAAHSTNAPASGNSIIARIVNRKLALG